MKPLPNRKKSCTPLLACESVSSCGDVGLSSAEPGSVDVNVRPTVSTCTVELTLLPDRGRSGVLKYAKPGAVNSSTYSPFGPLSKSYTLKPTIADDGSTNAVFICGQP